MNLLCRVGIHRWLSRPTRREGTTVYRCARCDACQVMHRHRVRTRKRFWLLGAALVSMLLWYVSIALGLTGHTKLLWGAHKVVQHIDKAGGHLHHEVQRALGDHGASRGLPPAPPPDDRDR